MDVPARRRRAEIHANVNMNAVETIARGFLASGGKRLRPRLCEAVYRSIRPEGADDLAPLKEAIECFHKASLVHDDIQDGDETRYGRPTVWKRHGIPVAVAVGDWLVAHGYELIARSGFANAAAMLEATAASHLRLCEGQGDELLGAGDYVSVCERKTGEAFALAATLGAMAAGAEPAAYREWGLVFGVLFQIRDDSADAGETDELRRLRAEYERRLRALKVDFAEAIGAGR